MPLHDPFDPDIILEADPFEDVDETQLQDPLSILQNRELRSTAAPTGSSKTPFPMPFQASPSHTKSSISSLSAERSRKASRPELGEVEQHKTCQICGRARDSATARDTQCVCDGKQESSLMNGI